MSIGPTEIGLVVLVLLLLFGASKLPELARGTGSALRIFKTETKGLIDDDRPEKQSLTVAPTVEDSQHRNPPGACRAGACRQTASYSSHTRPPTADPTHRRAGSS